MLLYIHIPFCISKCAYCDFFSRPVKNLSADKPVPESYLDALCNEISFRLNYHKVQKLETVYIGGGTPSILSGEQFKKLFSAIKKSGVLSQEAEITVEVNPDDVSEQLLECLNECGVNRISCGIQSMNDSALKKACRRADSAANERALFLLRDLWKGEVSVDLISALPCDDEKALMSSLEKVCSVNPDHISFYSLTFEDNTPFGKQLNSGALDYDFDEADKLWLSGRDFLEKHGYEWYEVSNFCKEGKECRHNLGYWNHENYIGCGSGATGSIYNKDGSAFRWTDTVNIQEYIDFWSTLPDVYDLIPQTGETVDVLTSEFEFFMMGLRKTCGISDADYFRAFGKALPESFLSVFEKWESKGLCRRKNIKNKNGEIECFYSMSRSGMLFLNRFLEELC